MSLPIASRRALLGVVAAATAALPPARAEVHASETVVSLAALGLGTGDGYDNAAVIERGFDIALKNGLPLVVPPGRFVIGRAIVLDVGPACRTGPRIIGSGRQMSILDFSQARIAGAAIAIISSGQNRDAFYLSISDLGLISQHDGPTLQIGKDDLSDSHNSYDLRRISINNGAEIKRPVGLRLNSVLNCGIDVVLNCGGKGHGTALQLRRAQFCTFTGSLGNAQTGVSIEGSYTFGNVFSSLDHEELRVAIRIVDSHATRNTWIGGTIADCDHGFDCRAGIGNLIINTNIALDGRNVILAGEGLTIQTPQAPSLETPAIPRSGIDFRNETGRVIRVFLRGGSVREIRIDGQLVSDCPGLVILGAGERIRLVYSGTPQWSWLPLA